MGRATRWSAAPHASREGKIRAGRAPGLDGLPRLVDTPAPVLQLPSLDPQAAPAATYLAASLHALAREEQLGRRPRRLLEPGHATWHRFRGRLGPRAFAELLLEDAAVSQPEPFHAGLVLGTPDPLEGVPEHLIADWLAAASSLPLDASPRDYLDEQARLLGLTARPAFSELRRVQPQHRVLELPGTGGRLAAHVVQTQPGIFLQDVFTIACGTWQERTFAGLVAVEAGVVGEVRVLLDPELERTRALTTPFTHVFGRRPDKGGRFPLEQLHLWFPAADIVLV